ncbi:MAG: hypothetical protein M0P27_02960 [Bacteroidales bacterium]|nr:hypothetical protein [Bacteroidales bacterium]
MRSKIILTTILLVLTLHSYGQGSWENWDRNYKEKDYKEIINAEKQYADSVEQNKEIPQYYSRFDKYKITAKLIGETRPIDCEVFMSMKRVFSLFFGNPSRLDGLIFNEYLFEIDGSEVWMPIQVQLENPLINEIDKGTETFLYCLFLNEHNQDGKLFNTFLISEFRKK